MVTDLVLESAYTLGDEGKFFVKTDVSRADKNGATVEWAGVVVHESLVNPGSLNIEVDGDFTNPAAGLTIHVNDNDVFDSRRVLPAEHQAVIDQCIAEAWANVEASDANTVRDVAADITQRLYHVYGVKAVVD